MSDKEYAKDTAMEWLQRCQQSESHANDVLCEMDITESGNFVAKAMHLLSYIGPYTDRAMIVSDLQDALLDTIKKCAARPLPGDSAGNEREKTNTFDFGGGPVPAHRHPNGGGWVADTAFVAETAFVGLMARVYGDAKVSGSARVYGEAKVFGSAQVYGDARVCGSAWVYGEAKVFGSAQVYGDARVYGSARIYGDARLSAGFWLIRFGGDT